MSKITDYAFLFQKSFGTSGVHFPLLIRKPLAASFLENDMVRFEEYMDRRRDLVVEVITQLMVPDAR